ncbi:MAG: bacillithiol biosynthesis cysteine-adding enzyme BshC [Bacteroidota bacterium]
MSESAPSVLSLEKKTIPYSATGYFGKAVLDYLSYDEKLDPFFGRKPELDSFREQIGDKAKSFQHRDTLVAALQNQYASAKLKSGSFDILKKPNAFTITTGHQVCFYTGPLYSFYKIVSVINTCKALKKEHPESDFVPVFWMATEDHDFEEANHFFLTEGKVDWESGQGGAVGRMNLVGMEEALAKMKDMLGLGYRSGELEQLFKSAYIKHDNVADATRYLIHHFFGDHGVICIDGDDPALKRLMVEEFTEELLKGKSFKAVQETNQQLVKDYSLQVTPREINLFYLDDELRERIVLSDDGNYEVLNTKLSFSKDEIFEELENHPERFSPNVILRPLYQEVILPNLAYIGGGGELNYWFQLQGVFESFNVPMPILMLRNSVLVIDQKSSKLMDKLGLTNEELFRNSAFELEQELVREASDEELNLKEAHEKLEALFNEMEHKLRRVNDQLEKSVRSGYARSERIVKNLEKKMLRAEKRKHEVLINRLQRLQDRLFPREGLQERNLNFAVLYEELGADLVPILIDHLDPFAKEFTVLRIR